MAFDDPLIDGNTLSGLELRRPEAMMLMADGTAGSARGGVRPGDPGLTTSVVGTTITVTAGVAAVNYSAQGIYRVYNPSSSTLTLTAAHATLPRVDLVYLRVWDNAVDSAGLAKAEAVYLAGTAAASPVAPTPTAPQIYIPLANINVPQSGGGSPSVDLSVRPVTVGPGGIGTGTSIPGVYAGQYRDTGTSTGTLQRYSGSAWEDKLYLAAGGQVNVGGSSSAAAFAGQVASVGTLWASAKVSGDSNNRLQVGGDGKLAWGPGSGSQDANFYRSAAGVLATDTALQVGTDLKLAGGTTIYRNALVATAVTVANTTTETVVGTLTIPANDAVVGAVYRARLIANVSFLASASLNWRARLGGLSGTLLANAGPTTLSGTGQTNKESIVSVDLVCVSTGGSGTWFAMLQESRNTTQTGSVGEVQVGSSDGTVTVDTTVSEAFVITAQWGAASASNTTTARVIFERVA